MIINLFSIPTAAGYRVMPPNVAWGVPGATVVPGVTAAASAAAAANGSLAPQMMYSAAMPQYQTQWAETWRLLRRRLEYPGSRCRPYAAPTTTATVTTTIPRTAAAAAAIRGVAATAAAAFAATHFQYQPKIVPQTVPIISTDSSSSNNYRRNMAIVFNNFT